MQAGIFNIHTDRFSTRLGKYERILTHNGIKCIRLDIHDPDFWKHLENLDLFIYEGQKHTVATEIARSVLPVIDHNKHIKCIPGISTFWPCNDRIKSYYLLRQTGFPVPQTYIFWHKSRALEWVRNAPLPLVFKLKTGIGAQNSFVINCQKQAKLLINRMFGKGVCVSEISSSRDQAYKLYPERILDKASSEMRGIFSNMSEFIWEKQKNYVLFQEYISERKSEVRILVIGNRAFVLEAHSHDQYGSVRNNLNKGYQGTEELCMEMAFDICRKLKVRYITGIFIVDKENRPFITDLTFDIPSDTEVVKGYWDHEFRWHNGPFWPEYFCLEDLLVIHDMKHPDIS